MAKGSSTPLRSGRYALTIMDYSGPRKTDFVFGIWRWSFKAMAEVTLHALWPHLFVDGFNKRFLSKKSGLEA